MFLFPKIKRVECREALRWYAASSVYARSFHEYRGKRSIIKRNSSRLPSWLVLPRSCMPRASEEIRKRGWFSRFFVLGHLLLLFQYPLPPSTFLSSSYSFSLLTSSFFRLKHVPSGAGSWLGSKIIREKAAKGTDRSCVSGRSAAEMWTRGDDSGTATSSIQAVRFCRFL